MSPEKVYSRRGEPTGMNMITAICLVVLLTSGCINSTTRPTPEEDTSVRELLQGSDCVVSIFGIGSRTPSVERAKLDGHPIKDPNGPSSSISKIRRIEVADDSFLLGSKHCIAVVGE